MKLDLQKDGIYIEDNFLSLKQCEDLNNELDTIFSPEHLSVNVYMGPVIWTSTLKRVALPTASIRSINLIELAIETANLIQLHDPISEHRILSALEVWQEENQPVPLFWHTDHREGMIRAFFYIEGGTEMSRAFKYMKGTHKRKNQILGISATNKKSESNYYHNKLSHEKIAQESSNIVIANNGPGALVVAYTEGFMEIWQELEEEG